MTGDTKKYILPLIKEELKMNPHNFVSGQKLIVKEMTSPNAIGGIIYDSEMEFVEIRGNYIILQDNKGTSSLTGGVAEYCFPVDEIGKTILPM